MAVRDTSRAISFYQARRCELGIGVRCHCRCGGKLHGAKRFGEQGGVGDFVALPIGDPHRVPYTLANEKRYCEPPLPFEPAEAVVDGGR